MAKNNKQKEALLGEFAHYIADIYRDELVLAIETQRYKSKWEPLDPKYLAWKKSQGLSTKVWESTSLLKDSITAYRSNNKWVVGINPRVKYPGSGVPVYKVARWLEYGTSVIPARPLFRPVKQLVQGRMRKYWDRFLLSKGIKP
jgi:hypothetical protein